MGFNFFLLILAIQVPKSLTAVLNNRGISKCVAFSSEVLPKSLFPDEEVVPKKGFFPPNRGMNFEQSEKPQYFPWQAAFVYNSEKKPWCGGVLINERYVLSAAHCFFECDEDEEKCEEMKAKDIEVVLGEYDWTKDSKNKVRSKVAKIINHPEYDNENHYINDIALLELQKPVELNDAIEIACMANNDPVEDDDVVISGWGLDENSKKPEILKWASLKISSTEECDEYWEDKDLQKHKIVCASDKKKDVCSGDSGGPLIMNIDGMVAVVGIVSWGAICADKVDGKIDSDAPGVYTSVAQYQSWIKENMQLN